MNEQFEKFREMQGIQEKREAKTKALQALGTAMEAAIRGRLDEMELNHPEILDKILELHLLVTYEVFPQLDPSNKPSEG